MSIFGIAKKGLGLLGKKKKKKTFLDRESKVIKRIKQRKRDDAIFKGGLIGTGIVGITGLRMESAIRDKERLKRKNKSKKSKP
tara:strand:+ start:1033 stop:1281 length:249 start_codon:yes stop_codon:yes gene_type:complete